MAFTCIDIGRWEITSSGFWALSINFGCNWRTAQKCVCGRSRNPPPKK
jgi:hypothetical protein